LRTGESVRRFRGNQRRDSNERREGDAVDSAVDLATPAHIAVMLAKHQQSPPLPKPPLNGFRRIEVRNRKRPFACPANATLSRARAAAGRLRHASGMTRRRASA
jgi:hypothetical protein